MQSDERVLQAMAVKVQNAEAEKRLAEKKLHFVQKRNEEQDALIASRQKQVSDLTEQLNEKISEIATMMRSVTDIMTGQGSVALSAPVREALIEAVRDEYEQQLQDKKKAYGNTIATLKAEIAHLHKNSGMPSL